MSGTAYVDRPIGGALGLSGGADRMLAYLRRVNAERAAARGVAPLTETEAREIVAAYVTFGVGAGIDGTAALAQAIHETNGFAFGGQVRAEQHNTAGIGATNDGAAGATFPTWADGIAMQFHHLRAWANLPGGERSLRYRQVVFAAQVKGYARTWRDLGGRWAVPGTGYGDGIERHWRGILAEKGAVMAPNEATDRMIAALRARGREVIDLRGKLPINPNPANRYGLVRGGLGGVTKLIQHWTGDAFGQSVPGAGVPGGTIPATLTVAQETALLAWYAAYHRSKDGGTWGGIAYGTMVLPSGRIYVNWDIGTLTYHAFDVNGYSYALCCPASNGQAPTGEQLASLNHVWWVLCEETPEIPAGWGDLWGHSEAKQFDPRNQTSCPGPGLLAHVQRARAAGGPSVTIRTAAAPQPDQPKPPTPPPADPYEDPITGHTVAPEFRALYDRLGGLAGAGRPRTPMVRYSDGKLRQLFDNMVLEFDAAQGAARIGGLGIAYQMQAGQYPVWGEIVPTI